MRFMTGCQAEIGAPPPNSSSSSPQKEEEEGRAEQDAIRSWSFVGLLADDETAAAAAAAAHDVNGAACDDLS